MVSLRRVASLLAPLVVATSATGLLPPWWVLRKVKPEGKPKDVGGWTAATFSEEQQAKFAVDGLGQVVDQEKFDVALQAFDEETEATGQPSSRRLMLPPWWLLHKVKPEGKPKEMHGWTAVTFSEEQQAKFAVDEDGQVVDQEKFDVALQAFDEERAAAAGQPSLRRLMEKPWWLLYHVKPEGKPKDMGGWTAVTFSEEQQQRFAVDEYGEILDEDKHAAALQALADEQQENVMAPPRKLYV